MLTIRLRWPVLHSFVAAVLLSLPPNIVAAPLDRDGDGIPDAIESAEGFDPVVKDNDIFVDAVLFVRQQYRDVLGREGESAGVQYWAQGIASGATARETLINTMVHSPEFIERLAPVIRLYLAYFKRAPDREGLLYWGEQLGKGMTIGQVSDQFAKAPEFIALYGPKTNAEFVQLVYRNVLERQPDSGGYAKWLGDLDAGRMSRGAVMVGFSQSEEYMAKSWSSVVVSMLYTAMLQRTPDAGGFAYWAGRLATGAVTEISLITNFYGSIEYRDRFVNYYGIAATPAAVDAARFLAQATFGPRRLDDIAQLQKKGYGAWLSEQFAKPAYSHMDYANAALARHNVGYIYEEDIYESVWQHWLAGEDQLRARTAFALSQIMVISNIAPNLNAWAMASYLDLLDRNAFGNYRTLLEEVALHPAMGFYLDMLKSQKEDPATGRNPNENFAREVLQLFSIGLVQLNQDGSPVLGSDGKPVPTYDEDTVRGFARAFSGWSFGGANTADSKAFFSAKANWVVPMQAWQMHHSQSEKKLLNGTVLPAFQSAERDMKDALDNIFYHPNVGPFICRQMIQRMIVSNPSRAAILRCATAFANNGAGERGDLKAVLRTILLDPEARDPSLTTAATWGKQREPVIRFANYLRAFGAASPSGRNAIHYLDSPDDSLAQSPLLAPSVFNFYSPNFRPVGPIAAAGLVAPEFQITTETSVVGALNFFGTLVDKGYYGSGDTKLTLNYSVLEALAMDPAKLVDHINMLLMAGAMSSPLRDTLVRAVAAMPTTSARNRVEAALTIAAASPEYVIQK